MKLDSEQQRAWLNTVMDRANFQGTETKAAEILRYQINAATILAAPVTENVTAVPESGKVTKIKPAKKETKK